MNIVVFREFMLPKGAHSAIERGLSDRLLRAAVLEMLFLKQSFYTLRIRKELKIGNINGLLICFLNNSYR